MLLRDHQSFPLSRSGRHVGWTRRLGRLMVVILVLTLLGAGVWVERELLLFGAAEVWIVSDPVSYADAAVVLGGGLDGRPFVAAKLYEQGLVKKILVSQVDDNSPAVAIGVSAGHTEANRQVLLKLGVPATAIDTFGMANKNTKDEAVALHAWAERHHSSAIIIPVEIFTARRVRWIFDREFSGQPAQIAVQSFDPPNYARTSWWQNEYGIIAFQNENSQIHLLSIEVLIRQRRARFLVFAMMQEVIIEAGRAERHYWHDLWRYRELFRVLAWRDVAVRYKQTVIGIAWALIRPFLTMVVFTVIFGKLANLPSEGTAPYAIWCLLACCRGRSFPARWPMPQTACSATQT